MLRDGLTVVVSFWNTTNPYTDPLSPDIDHHFAFPEHTAIGEHRDDNWDGHNQYSMHTEPFGHTGGLEALSAAATANSYPYMLPKAEAKRKTTSFDESESPQIGRPTIPRGRVTPGQLPPESMGPSNNNINFILNPTASMNPAIDPNLASHYTPTKPADNLPQSQTTSPNQRSDGNGDPEHEVAFLLRNFSEVSGQ